MSCFVDDFVDEYSQALTFGKNIIIAADLNCDMLKTRSPEAVALQDLCDSVNLSRLIREPTRVTVSSSTLIRELKQRQRRRQRERHKFAYLVGKNNSFARPARAFFTFVHLFAVVSKTTT